MVLFRTAIRRDYFSLLKFPILKPCFSYKISSVCSLKYPYSCSTSYLVPSISLVAFFLEQEFKIVVDSWKFSMLLLYILWDDWPIFMILRCIVSTCSFISKFSNSLTNNLAIFSSVPITMGINPLSCSIVFSSSAITLFFHFVSRYRLIGLVSRVFANDRGDLGSIPGRVIPKTLKMVLDTSLLNPQQLRYVSRAKWSNPEKGVVPSPKPRWSSALP